MFIRKFGWGENTVSVVHWPEMDTPIVDTIKRGPGVSWVPDEDLFSKGQIQTLNNMLNSPDIDSRLYAYQIIEATKLGQKEDNVKGYESNVIDYPDSKTI